MMPMNNLVAHRLGIHDTAVIAEDFIESLPRRFRLASLTMVIGPGN